VWQARKIVACLGIERLQTGEECEEDAAGCLRVV